MQIYAFVLCVCVFVRLMKKNDSCHVYMWYISMLLIDVAHVFFTELKPVKVLLCERGFCNRALSGRTKTPCKDEIPLLFQG